MGDTLTAKEFDADDLTWEKVERIPDSGICLLTYKVPPIICGKYSVMRFKCKFGDLKYSVHKISLC